MKNRLVKSLFVSLFAMLSLNSCSKDETDPKKDVVEEAKTKEQIINKTKGENLSLIIKPGYFSYNDKAKTEREQDYILEIYLSKDLHKNDSKVGIKLLRYGNEGAIEGYDIYANRLKKREDPQVVICGDPATSGYLLFDSKKNELRVEIPSKDSEAYIDSYELRDIISIKYDKQEDALLVQVNTPLKKEDGVKPTYKLKRVAHGFIEKLREMD